MGTKKVIIELTEKQQDQLKPLYDIVTAFEAETGLNCSILAQPWQDKEREGSTQNKMVCVVLSYTQTCKIIEISKKD